MSLPRRRTRLPATAAALARKLSRERIIPFAHPVETPHGNVTAVMLRGSLPIILISLPLLVVPGLSSPQALPLMALFLTASHGSVLVRRWVRRH